MPAAIAITFLSAPPIEHADHVVGACRCGSAACAAPPARLARRASSRRRPRSPSAARRRSPRRSSAPRGTSRARRSRAGKISRVDLVHRRQRVVLDALRRGDHDRVGIDRSCAARPSTSRMRVRRHHADDELLAAHARLEIASSPCTASRQRRARQVARVLARGARSPRAVRARAPTASTRCPVAPNSIARRSLAARADDGDVHRVGSRSGRSRVTARSPPAAPASSATVASTTRLRPALFAA